MSLHIDLNHLGELANKLKRLDLRVVDQQSIEDEVRRFVNASAGLIVGNGRSHYQLAYRAQDCEKTPDGFSKVRRMLYPPNGSNGPGRAHYSGSKVLYASWNRETALQEIRAKAGDIVQLITVRSWEGAEVPYYVIGEYQKFYMSGRLTYDSLRKLYVEQRATNRETFLRTVFVDAVMAEFFRMPVERDDNHNYKVTAAFTKLFTSTTGILLFPSVASAAAMNLAISANVFDASFEVVDTEVFRVRACYGYAMFDLEPLHYSSLVTKDEHFDWSANKRRNFVNNEMGGAMETQYVPGWRVPPA